MRNYETITRREYLSRSACGFGMLGLAGALGSIGNATGSTSRAAMPLGPGRDSIVHFPPRANRVIFLFMNGAPSHVDTFDPKPALKKFEGEQPQGKLYKASTGSGYMPSPFKFKRHGEGGVEISELLPGMAKHADDLCVVRSMHTDVPNHEPGLLMMNSGNLQPIRPSLGSWLSYGLGNENENLPAFVVLCPGRPVVGPQLWSNSFLPGEHQAMSLDTSDIKIDKMLSNLKHPSLSREQQRKQLDLLYKLNSLHKAQREEENALESQIQAMELAFRMQREATEAFDIELESKETLEQYGDSLFGRSCLLARRLAERGVRATQVHYVTPTEKQPWDTHKDNDDRHRKLCTDSDRATAALLSDLKARGMLDDTLVIWSGEFGRTPYSQLDKKNVKKKAGRDHHHTGFTTVLAGGGTKGGYTLGATDEFGMDAIEDRVHVHDLHATILHLMGLDHERLTYRYSGRDFRLTDVHGAVVDKIIS